MRRLACITGIVVCLALLRVPVLAAIPSSERTVLTTIYDTMGGVSWVRNGGWNGAPGTECSWYGVLCDSGQTSVTGLDLSWNNVAGPIPASIVNLTKLETLDFTANPLTGSFPSGVTQLTKLKVLRLGEFYGSPFGGTIDPALANLANLEELDLSGNELSGSIPAGLANLPKLRILDLRYNELTGSIPVGFFASATMTHLYLTGNRLSGTLPAVISMPELLELELSENNLTGSIPSSIGGLPKVVHLFLDQNMLNGPIPAALGQLSTLEILRIRDNQLTGSVPPEIGNLTNLTELDIGGNAFSGSIPSTIGNLKKLTYFSTYGSTLSGPVPQELFTLTELENLFLTGNSYNGESETKLSGSFADFTKLTKLKALDVGAQDISGPIPPQVSQLTELRSLGAGYDPIGGTIPSELGQLVSLTYVDLQSTGLSGPIPESFAQLTALETLNLRRNSITSLPDSFSNLKALKGLDLDQNQLSGPFPDSIVQLPLLEYLVLSSNQLSGPIPPALFSLSGLSFLDLSNNRLSGVIPPVGGAPNLEYFDLAFNALEGPLPGDIAGLEHLVRLDLSWNALSGVLPSFPGGSSLENIGLTGNEFTGTLPSFDGLSSLEYLYLGRNRFSGAIPASIGSLVSLRAADLSFNAFKGQIPVEIASCTSLGDGALGLAGNGLFNQSSSLVAFLDRTAPGFANEQTVAPRNVAVAAAHERSIVLTWEPIAYAQFNGGYVISVASSASGPFTTAVTTPDKIASTFTLDGLSPSTDYFIRVATATFSNPENKNTVVSDPSPVVSARTSDGTPAPASVVLLSRPGGLYQDAGVGGGTDGYTLANVGEVATTVTLGQDGDFFVQSPVTFQLAPGATQDVAISGLARPAGAYVGASSPSGVGVPAGLSVPVRLLSTEPVSGTVEAVASTNRVDTSADSSETSLPVSVSFTNTGTATLTGILVTGAEWISVPSGIVTIPPGGSVDVDFTVDRTRRSDAANLAGTAISSLSLVYPTGTQNARSTFDGPATGASLVTVVDTVKPPTDSVTFPPLAPGEVPLFLPGVGHVVGGVGLFLSDLSIINAFGVGSLGDVRIYYTPATGYPLTTSATSANPINPGQSFVLADVVKGVFDVEQVGTIQVRSAGWRDLVLTSNIFNVTNPRGTFGSSIPSFRADRSISAGSSLFINGLRKNDTTRTNIFVQETSGAPATVDLVFHDASGAVVSGATPTAEVPAFQLVRLIDAVPPGAVSVSISNREGSNGRIAAYATPVDQTSGDFWSLADWSRVYASLQNETQVIPVAGKVRGVNNTFFRSDVSISATGEEPAAASVRLVYNGGLTSTSTNISLVPGETLVLDDVVGALFPSISDSVVGSIYLTPSTGSLSVTSRTYATQDGVPGTYGTAVPTLPLSSTIRLGQTKVIAGLDVASIGTITARTPGTFRTNLFLVEAAGAPARVRVAVVYADRSQAAFGSRLVTKTLDLAPNQIYQTNIAQLIAETNPGVGDLRNVQLEFRVLDGDGAVFAFTSSIDNGTADQILRVE